MQLERKEACSYHKQTTLHSLCFTKIKSGIINTNTACMQHPVCIARYKKHKTHVRAEMYVVLCQHSFTIQSMRRRDWSSLCACTNCVTTVHSCPFRRDPPIPLLMCMLRECTSTSKPTQHPRNEILDFGLIYSPLAAQYNTRNTADTGSIAFLK